MTETPTIATPVQQGERIAALDVLRGFALLGILMMNIQAFAMPDLAYLNPTAYGDLTGANRAVWIGSHVFFDQKFMTLFSLLFGAGIILFTTRAEEKGRPPAGLHYRRMFWLLVLGMVHAYGFWTGDILVTYALSGMIVYPLRRRSPPKLITIGLALIAVGSTIWILLGWSMQFWHPEDVAAFKADAWKADSARISDELDTYRSGWWTQMQERVPVSLEWQTLGFLIWGFWRAGGLMLVGMGLFKLGIITGQKSSALYRRLFTIGILAGMPLVLYGVYRNFSVGWDVRYSFFFGSQWNYWGSLLVSAAWMGMVMLAMRADALRAVMTRLAAVGRMAFSNYLLHTIICTTIFYGHGFGLFGSVPRVGQALIVVAIWVLQLIISPIWLRHFQFGPFEWVWRSLTYWRQQPFRRPGATPVAVG